MPTKTPGVGCIAGRIRLQFSAENRIGTRHAAVESASDRRKAHHPGRPGPVGRRCIVERGPPTAPRERSRASPNDRAGEAVEDLVLHEAMIGARRVGLEVTPAPNGEATLRRVRKDEGARPPRVLKWGFHDVGRRGAARRGDRIDMRPRTQ